MSTRALNRAPRPFPFNQEPHEPKEATNTTWHNPTSHEQKVIVHEGDQRIVYRVPAGGTKEIPARHDMFIHRVQCTKDECRARGGFCREGHPGVVHGGLAPQLVRVGPRPEDEKDELAKGLDTEAEIREQLELQQVAADERRRRAEIDSMIANKRAHDLASEAAAPPKRAGAAPAATGK